MDFLGLLLAVKKTMKSSVKGAQGDQSQTLTKFLNFNCISKMLEKVACESSAKEVLFECFTRVCPQT